MKLKMTLISIVILRGVERIDRGTLVTYSSSIIVDIANPCFPERLLKSYLAMERTTPSGYALK
jgi:hypothetical protein